jgi:serine/threonine kinase 32
MSIKSIIHSKMHCFNGSEATENNKDPVRVTKTEIGLNVDSFKFYRMLGKGSYAKVRVAVKKDTGELFAIKCYNKQHIIDKKAVNTVLQERKLLSLVNHPFCIFVFWAFQTDSELFLVMNLLQGGDLRFHLGRKNKFSHTKARFYLAQIALAIDHLHSLQLVHRDIKPENIGIDSKGNAVLMDMGLTRRLNPGQLFHDKTGTAAYMAPEVWSGLGYSYSADWWSLGITFYELMTGELPFELHPDDYRKGIVLTQLTFPDYIHPLASDLLSKLLEVDFTNRIGCGPMGIDELKMHPFFEGFDWDKLIKKQLITPFIPKNGVAYCDPNLDANDFPYPFNPKQFARYSTDLFAEWDYNVADVSVTRAGEGDITASEE